MTLDLQSLRKLKLFFSCTAVCMTVLACHPTEFKTDRIKINAKEALTPERSDSVRVTVDVEYPSTGIDDATKSCFLETISSAVFGSDYSGLPLEKAANQWVNDFINEYKETNLDILNDVSSETAGEDENILADNLGILTWENVLNGYFSGKYKDVISYTIYNYVFTGGAHGSTTETAINMNMATGKQVTEEDFFIPGYKEELSALLTAHLRDAMTDQDSYDALFVKDIEPNGNFKVSEQGITYIYGQYEIGPYYLGIIKVSVPWEELGDLVREHPVKSSDK